MKKINVLIIGSGGREDAYKYALAQSQSLGTLYIAPGNDGMSQWVTRVSLKPSQINELADFAAAHDIGLTIVGPENPLAEGIVDVFTSRGLKIFGPTRAAAQLESSKAFAVGVMHSLGIPCPTTIVRTSYNDALLSVRGSAGPWVMKTDGLCAGKGVMVCHTKAAAEAWLAAVMGEPKVYGQAGATVLIQQYVPGYEVSFHAWCDGKTFKLFPTAQDHKQLLDGDQGENTGGMGAFGPVPWVTPALTDEVGRKIIQPVLDYMVAKGMPYVGILYVGLMLTKDGYVVLEFNVRGGDPEMEVFMRQLKSDLVGICLACVEGRLNETEVTWSQSSVVCITLASQGYPGKPEVGQTISGLEQVERRPEICVFTAGVKLVGSGTLVTDGGRVIYVTAMSDPLESALQLANEAADLVQFSGKQRRTDIGRRLQPRFT